LPGELFPGQDRLRQFPGTNGISLNARPILSGGQPVGWEMSAVRILGRDRLEFFVTCATTSSTS
jgi:hypothetical protein